MNQYLSTVFSILNGIRTLAITCAGWGDSGKGKFVDLFARWASLIIRCTGGPNAGHTIVVDGKTYILHQLPSGILYDAEGKLNVIGSGVAFDPTEATKELAMLALEGILCRNLRISYRAPLLLPQHIALDLLKEMESTSRIGTTGRGIGPCYTDRVARRGLTVNDLLNKDIFVRKLRRNLAEYERIFGSADPEVVAQVMRHERLLGGRYAAAKGRTFDPDAILEQYLQYAEGFREFICDTDELVRESIHQGQRVLLEGAQGLLLSIEYGTYPFVTSSECSPRGLAMGAGISERAIDLNLGVVKFYDTRVGKGPFPSEIGGSQSEAWCNSGKVLQADEARDYGTASVNDPDPFTQGIALRLKAGEYGATTKRPRRIGWRDLVMLRHALRILGPDIIVTKPDVLSGVERVKTCGSYRYIGPCYRIGGKTLEPGAHLTDCPPDSDVLSACEPVYREYDGWQEPIGDIREFMELPTNLRKVLRHMETATNARLRLVSVGPSREQTVVAS